MTDEELLQSVYKNDISSVKGLIQHGDVTQHGLKVALHAAVSLSGDSQTEIIKLLLLADIDPNSKNIDGRTILHSAVEAMHWSPRHMKTVKLLLANPKVDVNAQDNYGDTPLHIATANGNMDAVRELLNHGCDVLLKNSFKENALGRAINNNNVEIAKLLSDVVLIKSVCAGDIDAVRIILKENSCTPNGMRDAFHASTSLMGGPQLEILKCFLAAGVDINCKGDDGRNVIHKSIESMQLTHNHIETLQLLVKQKGIDINAQDHFGLTPLHIAGAVGNKDAIMCLLENNADVTLKNCRGETALEFARLRCHKALSCELSEVFQNLKADEADIDNDSQVNQKNRKDNSFGLAQKQVVIGSSR